MCISKKCIYPSDKCNRAAAPHGPDVFDAVIDHAILDLRPSGCQPEAVFALCRRTRLWRCALFLMRMTSPSPFMPSADAVRCRMFAPAGQLCGRSDRLGFIGGCPTNLWRP